MPPPIKDNIELICMIVTIFMAVGAVAYKSHDIEALKTGQKEIRAEFKQDHDTLISIATDVKWMRQEMDRK